MISADSLAISTAVSTEIPTSEFIREGLSFIPSPIKPTIFPSSFKSLTILAFCIGDNFAKILTFFNILITAWSDNLSISFPKIIFLDFKFTLSHTHLVTSALSPVKTITLIPELFSFSIAAFALPFGGSRKPINPSRTIFFSELTLKIVSWAISFFWHIAITLKPSLFKLVLIFLTFSFISFVSFEISPL